MISTTTKNNQKYRKTSYEFMCTSVKMSETLAIVCTVHKRRKIVKKINRKLFASIAVSIPLSSFLAKARQRNVNDICITYMRLYTFIFIQKKKTKNKTSI